MLHEKRLPFEVEYVDIYSGTVPTWLTSISPLGKVPVLMVGNTAIFDSGPIAEYIDEISVPALLPMDPLRRAVHRSWMVFASKLHDDIRLFFSANARSVFENTRQEIIKKLETLSYQLDGQAFFRNSQFSLVDAFFIPPFLLLDEFARYGVMGIFDSIPQIVTWKEEILRRPSARAAIHPEYSQELAEFIRRKGSVLAQYLPEESCGSDKR